MRHPALALIELNSVAIGILAADTMVKRAPIALFKAGTVQPGRYLVLIGGSVASVEEAFRAGIDAAGTSLADSILIPDVHANLYDAVAGEQEPLEREALGVFETRCVASLLGAADAAVKGAEVSISRLRMADGLGGRAFVLFDGAVADVEAALEIAAERSGRERTMAATIMPRLDRCLRQALDAGTHFASCEPLQPEGAEIPVEKSRGESCISDG